MIKVGIDIQSTLGKKTGIGYYTKNLVEHIKDYKDLELYFYQDPVKHDYNTLQRMLWENIRVSRYARNSKIDLLHVPGFAGPLAKGKYQKITTVHDLIGMIYPDNLGYASRFYWQKWLPCCIKNSDCIIADSQNTKADIIKFLDIVPDKIRVIPLAVDSYFKSIEKSDNYRTLLKKYGITGKYILNVGTIEPRKNIPMLIESFSDCLKETNLDGIVLVIVGKKGWDYKRCYQKVLDLNLKDRIVFCDYISEEHLSILYNFAEAFVYPSLYEGFGLPVLEAMSCAVPVICSETSSLPEITGKSAILIDPNNRDMLKNALLKLLTDEKLKNEMSCKALEESKKFSWKKTALETIKIYREVYNEA